MSDRYVEKSFLWLLVLSLLLHLGVLVALYYLPEPEPPPREPVFIDLRQMPEPEPPRRAQQGEAPRVSDQRIRVERETAPRGTDAGNSRTPRQAPSSGGESRVSTERREERLQEGSSVAALLKPRGQVPGQQARPQLFPGADSMARLEENYRRKFEKDIAEGDTAFLNTDNIQFASFLRRFENSVYGVWRYPQEAAMKGIEGITPVRITFNRRGEIVQVQLLESSGATVLDDEVMRTLRLIGPVGGFPKGYDKDEFHLIAFFHYGITRRSLR